MSDKKTGPINPKKSLATRAKEEPDPAWRNWYLEIDNRRKALQNRKAKPLIISTYQKDGQNLQVARPKSDPTPIKKFLKTPKKNPTPKITQDLLWLRETWPKTVGPEIAEETEIFAFKNGALTISVSSSPLLQEIRQFHADAIIADLRDIWQASVPLLKITYKLGKK